MRCDLPNSRSGERRAHVRLHRRVRTSLLLPCRSLLHWEERAERDHTKWGESLMAKRRSSMPWCFATRSQCKYGKRTLTSGVQEVAVSHGGQVAAFLFNGAAVKLCFALLFFFFFEMSTERLLLSHLCTVPRLHASLIYFFPALMSAFSDLWVTGAGAAAAESTLEVECWPWKCTRHTQGDSPGLATRAIALFCLKAFNILTIVIYVHEDLLRIRSEPQSWN